MAHFAPSSAAIKGPHPHALCLRPAASCPTPVSSLLRSSMFTAAALHGQSHSLPLHSSLQVPKHRRAPEMHPRPLGASPSTLESRHVVAAPVSFCLDVTPLPQSVSKATTSLCRCATVRGGASMSTLLWICCWRAAPSRIVRAQRVRGRRDHGPPLRGVDRAKSGRSGSVTGPGQATCTVRVGRQRDFGPFSIKNRKSFFYFYSFSI
jgi:hypothetical protein